MNKAAPHDVVIVGSGPNGAMLYNQIRAGHSDATILMIEAGPAISAQSGEHLIEAEEGTLREAYERLMRLAKQIAYVQGAADARGTDSWSPTDSGITPAAYLGNDMRQFPGAAMAWNVGGMGVHWTAACPWPFETEVPSWGGTTFQKDMETARTLLRVGSEGYPHNPYSGPIIRALQAALPAAGPERSAQAMPMAGLPHADGKLRRTGPRDIAGGLFDGSDPLAKMLSGKLVTRLLHTRGSVTGVVVRDVVSGKEEEIAAKRVVVAADTLRTPQLLWASGIRPAALGTRLNEHATIDGGVVIDAKRLGVAGLAVPQPAPDEPFIGAYWSPSNGAAQPTHGQMMETFDPERGHHLGMSWYVSTDIREENRLEFSDTQTDALGMPRITAHYNYSDADLERIEAARGLQAAAGSAIGEPTAGTSELLPPGASLHYTGTVRMGLLDDGSSVCDVRGRVWGFDNLTVAGNGVVPTALTCNSTLAGAALTVGIARSVL